MKTTWETFLAKPCYPTVDKTYSIKRDSTPTEDAQQQNRYLIDALDIERKTAVRLQCWEATLRELAMIMSAAKTDNVLVVFTREETSNRTHVKRCTEEL